MPDVSHKEKQESLVDSLKSKVKKEKLEPQLTENALRVVEKRYLQKDKDHNFLENPAQMFHRVATSIAKVDLDYGVSPDKVKEFEDQIYQTMCRMEFLPNSPTFWGAGTKSGQLSACFVLPVEDNMKSILKTQMDMGLIHKSGGGTGFSFSRLRPNHSPVGSTGGVASGPLGFMQMYNDTSNIIKEGGRRRGANMGMLRVDHPDIMEFITYKETEGNLSNFNISVAVTDKFMKAVEDDNDFDLIDPSNNEVTKTLKAREIFEKIVAGAWRNGEPGIIFIDEINRLNPVSNLGDVESTNPCGEQPLLPYESCNLGSINVSKMIIEKDGKNEVDWDKFAQTIELAAHFLDNVIDANKLPIPEIEEMTRKARKIGLGVMGFAEMLIQLNIPYNSNKGLAMAEKMMKFLSDTSHAVSSKTAEARGNFPAFKGSSWDKKGVKFMRNATTTTIAPTGTIGMIASASSGIEPIFALVYTKTVMDGVELVEVNNFFKNALQKEGIYSEELVKKVAANHGSVKDMDEIPDHLKNIFVTAGDITPEWHVKMQASLQKYTDNAISKTINFPFEATIEDVEESYKLAWHLKTKGLTVYRDGSRQVQVLTTGTKDKEKSEEKTDEIQTVVATGIRIIPRERPDVIHGSTYRMKTAYGKLFVTINDDEEGMPFEMFSTLGKTGGFFASNTEAICRLISLALRAGIDPQEVIDQIKGIRGPQPTWGEDGKMILSLPDAIGQLLERHMTREQPNLNLNFNIAAPEKISEEEVAQKMESINTSTPVVKEHSRNMADSGEAPACPECSAMLEFTEGCLKCTSCGYSKCS
jgi:ribonucleoside-diphosphate reductase alpha chain